MIDRLDFSFFKKNTPIILQEEQADCGLACIVMLMHFFGKHKTLKSLKSDFSFGQTGASLEDLKTVGDSVGFNCRGLKVDLNEVGYLKLPAIVHWGMDHFVVLTQVSNEKYIIHDPAIGKRELSRTQFSNFYTGIALELFPGDAFNTEKPTNSIGIFDFVPKAPLVKSSFNKILILTVFMQLFALTFPFYYFIVIDRVVNEGDSELLNMIAVTFFSLCVFNFASTLLNYREGIFLSSNIMFSMMSNMVKHLLHLPVQFFEGRKPSAILSRVASVQNIERESSSKIVVTIVDACMALLIVVIMLFYSVKLTLVVAAFSIFYMISAIVYYRKNSEIEKEVALNATEESVSLIEAISAVQTTKLYGKENQQLEEWQKTFTDSLNVKIKSANVSILFSTFSEFVFSTNRVILIAVAATLTFKNEFSVGQFFAFFLYTSLLVSKIQNLTRSLVALRLMKVHIGRVEDILLEQQEADIQNAIKSDLKGGMKINKIGYSYLKHSKPVFKDVTVNIKPGEFVGIVGPSGCGKTTLIKVLLGLYQPRSGNLIYDGVAFNKYARKKFRSQVATVMQDEHIFSCSIAKNIALFENAVDYERVKEVCKLTLLNSVVDKLPMGFETQVRQGTSLLSGGQKQRLFLARALYKNPKIIFIDEGTSSLDQKAEMAIYQNLKTLNITRIVIAHNPKTIEFADKILEWNGKTFLEKNM